MARMNGVKKYWLFFINCHNICIGYSSDKVRQLLILCGKHDRHSPLHQHKAYKNSVDKTKSTYIDAEGALYIIHKMHPTSLSISHYNQYRI